MTEMTMWREILSSNTPLVLLVIGALFAILIWFYKKNESLQILLKKEQNKQEQTKLDHIDEKIEKICVSIEGLKQARKEMNQRRIQDVQQLSKLVDQMSDLVKQVNKVYTMLERFEIRIDKVERELDAQIAKCVERSRVVDDIQTIYAKLSRRFPDPSD